jgi:hypothetical protein
MSELERVKELRGGDVGFLPEKHLLVPSTVIKDLWIDEPDMTFSFSASVSSSFEKQQNTMKK